MSDPTPSPRAARSVAPLDDERRAAVCEVALGLVAQRGLAGTRLREISERVGMVPSHLMYYFGSKQQLFVAVLEHVEVGLLAAARERMAAEDGGWERLAGVVEVVCPRGPGDPRWVIWFDAWELATRDAAVAELLEAIGERWAELFEEVIRAGQAAGELRATTDARALALELTTLLDGLAIRVVTRSGWVDRTRMVALLLARARAELL